jgi:DNA mismatch endonuclease, patch repair protein
LPCQAARCNVDDADPGDFFLVDIVDPATRSRMMSGIRARNTRPEMRLRRELHALGFRFRLHAKDLPGKPDLLLKKHNVAIFVHGCFWHRHPDCRLASAPASNSGFWAEKFARNAERDMQATAALRNKGWRVAVVWECGLRRKDIAIVMEQVKQWLLSDDPYIELPRAREVS